MNQAHIRGLDLGLLVALDALLRERQVTRAARRVGLTQSAMSHALQRLREVFGDPLFLSAPLLVARSDLVLTAPARLARVVSETLPLEELKPPLEVPCFHLYQVWHQRRQHDPAHAWLRSCLAQIAQTA